MLARRVRNITERERGNQKREELTVSLNMDTGSPTVPGLRGVNVNIWQSWSLIRLLTNVVSAACDSKK